MDFVDPRIFAGIIFLVYLPRKLITIKYTFFYKQPVYKQPVLRFSRSLSLTIENKRKVKQLSLLIKVAYKKNVCMLKSVK